MYKVRSSFCEKLSLNLNDSCFKKYLNLVPLSSTKYKKNKNKNKKIPLFR